MPENEGEDLWDENSQQQMDQVWNLTVGVQKDSRAFTPRL